jgi:hypothetical protein
MSAAPRKGISQIGKPTGATLAVFAMLAARRRLMGLTWLEMS